MPRLWDRLFSSRGVPGSPTPASQSPAIRERPVEKVNATLYSGHETLEVVGESHYQEALWEIVGGRTSEPVRFEALALLIPNPDNEFDANAIEVWIDGLLVGHLSRQDAAAYRPGLIRLMQHSEVPPVALHAVVVGGGRRGSGLGYLGVFLDHDPTDFGVASHHISHGRFQAGELRTGLSEEIEGDHRAEMAWYRRLPEEDRAGIADLRWLLEHEGDPISRHYMFCELEHRLYRSRTTLPAALDEFDVVCEQHHSEMTSIRPALVDRFGAVPLIEMYRQAAIRYQKMKLWTAAREWAQRGINLYGDQAARPEAVEDLRHRVIYATAKLEQSSRPQTRRSVPVAAGPVRLETLTCADCGRTFKRVVTRGRKPRTCPTCRGEQMQVAD
jgi:predicted Zn-ribbon and HTH transcriptional regulator